MCAISGIYKKPGLPFDLRVNLENMRNLQHHRGPDACGMWLSVNDAIGLAHNRLSIVDLSEAGNQPMHSADERYTIVFNGEIYNYRELKQLLITKGSRFYTCSDTEVLLEAYRHWGEDMLYHLRGMFAFAIYDHTKSTLFCARDRIGKKPLVYAQTDWGVVFASEIPPLLQIQGIDSAYNHNAIAAMMLHNLRHIPDPHTAYQGIKRLRAGHAMRIKFGRIEQIWRYWTPTQSNEPATPQQLRSILEESVELRMRADVPVGALLSGGIDSSAIVALMQKHATQPIHTYALGFDQDDEDLYRARKMALKLGTIHKEFYFDPEKQWQIFNKLIATYGEPIMLLPLVHAYTLYSAVRDDGIKVVLTGNGADEIFYGYSGHTRIFRLSRFLDYVTPFRSLLTPLKLTRLNWITAKPGARKSMFYNSIARSTWQDCLSSDAIDTIANSAAEEVDYWGNLCPSQHYIDESNFVALMVENTHSVTTAGDLPAMAASIEVRAPFLDQELIAFALGTPPEMKIPNVNNPNWLKAILRDAVYDLIPESLLKAPKRGFGSGIQEDALLRGAWKSRAEEIMESPNTVDGLFSKDAIRKQWCGFLNGDKIASQVAKQFAVQCWLRGGNNATH